MADLSSLSDDALLSSIGPAPAAAHTPAAFVAQHAGTAAATGQQLGVDPNLLLAQWGLETGWGKSVIPGTNNLGNIKDFSGGGVAARDNATGSNDNYRAYASPDAFAADQASLLSRKYPGVVGAGSDVQKFAAGLRGYAEDPQYGQKLAATAQTVAPRTRPRRRNYRASAMMICSPRWHPAVRMPRRKRRAARRSLIRSGISSGSQRARSDTAWPMPPV
jgi:hypothetical protein